MRMRIWAAALAAAWALGGTPALAQTTTGTLIEPDALAEPEGSADALAFPEEHAAVLRDFIRRRPIERIVAIPGAPVRPGRVMPRTIRLSPLAHVPVEALNRYAYVVSPDDKIVVVDPSTRRVVHVMDR